MDQRLSSLSLLLVLLLFRRLAAAEISRETIPVCPAHLRHSTSSDGREVQGEYDIVVIGAGAAGSIVGSELATRLDTTVLLVEAGVETGKHDNANISDPALWLNVVHNATLEWLFRTRPQPSLNNRTIELGFAKGTGGSAMHNAMGYVRGGRAWMDAWETHEGCSGWNAATLTPYFDRVEEILGVLHPANDSQGLVETIFQASHEAGFPYNPSYNRGEEMFGIANFVMSINEGDDGPATYERVTSYDKYLRGPSPSNLQLVTGLQAIGFNYVANASVPTVESVALYDGEHACQRLVGVRKELILSAGAINSPRLLQLSGIGNGTHLRSLGVDVVKDLPGVGNNLRDDLVVNLLFVTETTELQSPPASFLSAVLFAADNASSSSSSSSSSSLTNVEMLFSTGNMIGNGWPKAWQNSLVLSPNVQQCLSRGSVLIESVDPLASPAVDPGYLSVEADVDRVLNAIELSRRLLAQPSFGKWRFEEVSPGRELTSRSDLIRWIRQEVGTGFHYIGTCKMGTDHLSVVNPANLKVWGVERLRIVDASVAPASFSANTQSLTYALAARAVDLIAQDYVSVE